MAKDKDAFGSLGPNKDRQSDNHPTMKGKITLNCDLRAGDILYLAAWTKIDDEDGHKWLSIVGERPKSGSATVRAKPAPKPAQVHDDEIPF